MAAPATGMAGLFGGQGPTGYVNSLYAPLQAQLQQQQRARVGTLNDLVGSILASLKAPQPDVYGAAAQDQTAAANGAAQTLARVNPDAQTQAMLRAIGAPQSQQDVVGGQNNVTFSGQGALGQYVGGALPAGVFAQDQAARNTYLQSLPATVGLSALQGLGHMNLLASNENAKLASDKAGAQQKALTDLANFVQKRQSVAFDQRFKVGQANEHIAEFNARQNLSVTKMQWQQANADRTYGLNYSKFMAAEQRAAQIAKNGGLSAAGWSALQPKVQDFTKGLYQGVPGHVTYPNSSNGLKAPRIDSWKQQPATYQQAIKTLIRRFPALGASGAIAAADGLYQPGEGGRPLNASSLPTVKLNERADAGSPLMKAASSMLGTPYVWGGNTPGKALDCSGFVQQVYKQAGINIPRTTYQQVKAGKPVDLKLLQPGDAIFTIPGPRGPEHVGLYIGNGQVQVSPETGDVNKIVPLKDYLALGFVAARRYTP